MNFAPFGSSFPGTITGIPQFTSSGNIQTTIVTPTQSSGGGALVSDTSVVTNIVNLDYNAPSNTNMANHFNQQTLTSTTTIPTKFRNDELLTEKYNGGQHLSSSTNSTNQQQQQQQQYTVSYNQPSEDKRLVAASITYPTQNTITIASTGSNNQQQQAQTQELSQELCNAILQQSQQQQQINQQTSQQQNVDTKRGE